MALPPISVCIPLYNGADWLEAAVESTLAQTRTDFELLIVDNGSTDGSLPIAQAYADGDDRIHLEHFELTIGAIANHNRCLELACGRLIKFLHHDDTMRPDCLERMAGIFDNHPGVGLVFSRREIVLEDPDDPAVRRWVEEHATLHEGFGELAEVNRGTDLLDRWLPVFGEEEFENWVGEPSATMFSREALDRAGMFNQRVWQSFDLELWLRLMAVSDVGFVDEPLVSFRHHTKSLTAKTAVDRKDWLDRLWLLEALLADPAFAPYRKQLREFRRRELRRVARRQGGRLTRGHWDLRPIAEYAAHRLHVGRAH